MFNLFQKQAISYTLLPLQWGFPWRSYKCVLCITWLFINMSNVKCQMVQMECIPQSLIFACLVPSWGDLGGVAFLEEVCHWGSVVLKLRDWHHMRIFSLHILSAFQDVSSQLLLRPCLATGTDAHSSEPQLAVSLPSHSCLGRGVLSLQQETKAQVGSKEWAAGATDLSSLFVGQLRKTLGFWILEKQLNAVSRS